MKILITILSLLLPNLVLADIAYLTTAPELRSDFEPETLEQELRFMQHLLHREYGVRAPQQIEILDRLVDLYVEQGQKRKALVTSEFAFDLRLEHAGTTSDRFYAYQLHGDLLSQIKELRLAAKTYAEGGSDKHLSPTANVNLLVAHARLSLSDRRYLVSGVEAMRQAILIAERHDLPNQQALSLSLADLLMVGGDVRDAKKIYELLWATAPRQRQDWFGEPKLLFSGETLPHIEAGLSYQVKWNGRSEQARFGEGVRRQERQKISRWLAATVHRPAIKRGRLQSTEVDFDQVVLGP